MKRGFKKLGAVLLTVAMAFAMNSTVFAANLTNGEVGGYTSPDSPTVQDNSINIVKEIVAYNPNGTTVNAPIVTYTYEVTPATVAGLSVTDDTSDHDPAVAVTAPVNQGITTGLVVTGTAAGSAGNDTKAEGTLVFTNSSTFATALAGQTNSYDINLDFENVAFTQPGVYRYQIVETTSATLSDVAIQAGSAKTRFLDVYVDSNLKIYGYVCMATNDSVTPSTAKTNGFVASSNGADSYYTYDLTLSKTVNNDAYGKANTAFPFTVIFNNTPNYSAAFAIGETAGTGSTGITPAAGAAPAWKGVAEVKDGGAITYTGIPAGVDVDVYETNIVTGATYSVSTSVNGGTPVVDGTVVWGTKPTTAVAQTTKADYESTKATVDTSVNTAVTANQTFAIINTLLLISPTGFIVRFAPYMLVLMGGLFLIVLGVVLYKRTNKEEA